MFSDKIVSRSCADKEPGDVWCKLEVNLTREFCSKLDVNIQRDLNCAIQRKGLLQT